MIDIDHFKRINDSYGHATGDSVLVIFSEILHQSCRDKDILGRLGGEEFAIVMPCTDLAAASDFCNRIHERVRLLAYHKNNQNICFTFSAGIKTVVFSKDAQDVELNRLLSEADKALYQAKESGRNQTKQAI